MPLRGVCSFGTAAAAGRAAQVDPGANAAFEVRYAASAREDQLRLFDFLLDWAKSAEDFDAAQAAIDVFQDAVERSLSRAPFAYRRAGDSPFVRELLIPFGGAGHVELYEIKDAAQTIAMAVRHQLGDDCR